MPVSPRASKFTKRRFDLGTGSGAPSGRTISDGCISPGGAARAGAADAGVDEDAGTGDACEPLAPFFGDFLELPKSGFSSPLVFLYAMVFAGGPN